MERNLMSLVCMVLGVAAVSSVTASPISVKTAGTKSQTSFMCPDCKTNVACAQAGDFRIGLMVDIDNPKLGSGKLVAHVNDRAKKPVDNAKVTVTLSMPEHKHTRKPITLKSQGDGEYAAPIQGLHMSGAWKAMVEVNQGGDVIRQSFSFTK